MRFPAVVLLVLAGCASPPAGDLAHTRAAWAGASYEEVVRHWGAPARSTTLPDGREAHTWVSEGVASRASLWPSIGIFGGSGGVGFGTGVTMGPGYGELQRCERTLFFSGARVVEQSWQGPPGYCASFRR